MAQIAALRPERASSLRAQDKPSAGSNLAIPRSVGDCHVDVKAKLGILVEAYIPRATVWWFLNLLRVRSSAGPMRILSVVLVITFRHTGNIRGTAPNCLIRRW